MDNVTELITYTFIECWKVILNQKIMLLILMYQGVSSFVNLGVEIQDFQCNIGYIASQILPVKNHVQFVNYIGLMINIISLWNDFSFKILNKKYMKKY